MRSRTRLFDSGGKTKQSARQIALTDLNQKGTETGAAP
jgi:hypothetical protein